MTFELNNGWLFYQEGQEPIKVNLPHDAMITERRYPECRSGKQGAYFSGGKYTYSKELNIEQTSIGKSIELLFEGVYQNASVAVNNKAICTHKNGFTEFVADISDAVIVGVNLIEVTVDNSLVPNCRWYTGSGIYRPVSLIIRDRLHIKDVHIKTLSYNPAVIEVIATATEDINIKVEIKDGHHLIYQGDTGRITIENPKLWTVDLPHLYTCIVSCGKDEKIISFGIRKIEWSGASGLLINGKETLLRGGCIHHDNGVLGACGFTDAEYRRVKILKEQGFNALRISHNPASRAILAACDRLGMYVIDESFDGWYITKDYHDYSRVFWQEYENDLESMIKKDINHPSVIIYSVGNEVTETANDKGINLLAKMRDFINKLDDTRPVTCGINVLLNVYVQLGIGVYKDMGEYKAEPLPEESGYKERKAGSAFFNAFANKLGGLMFFMSKGKRAERIVRNISPSVDIVGLNYASSRYDKDAKKYPERMMIGTETMVGDLPYNWERVKKYKSLIGDFVWSAWDYLGEACIGDWTYHSYKGLPLLAGQGMIDITGKPLASMYFMQTVWGMRDKPFIAVRPLNHAHETPSTGAWQFTNAIDSWTWHGYEGKKTTIEVYSDAYMIRLELNGKVIATKKIKKFKSLFNTKYESGTLTAIALDESGKEISRSILSTGNLKTKLTLKADRKTLSPNGQDLCFIEIEFTDENGNLKPFIEQRVELSVKGISAVLQGFGSALCKTDEVFDKAYHDSYRGRCLAVIRATNIKGITEITVFSNNTEPVALQLEVK